MTYATTLRAKWYQIRMILPVVISCLHDPRPQRVSFTQDYSYQGYHRREPVMSIPNPRDGRQTI